VTTIEAILFFGWAGTSLANLLWCHFLGRWISAIEKDLALLRDRPRFMVSGGVIDG
jgi:hypothetical protein